MSDKNNEPDPIVMTEAGVPTLQVSKIDVPFSGYREGTLGDLLEKGGAVITDLAAANGHNIGVKILSEQEAALIRDIYKPKDALEAEAELLGRPSQIVPATGKSIIRGAVVTDSKNRRTVTVIQCNSGKTKSGQVMHTVVDNKSGEKYKVSALHLK